MRKCAANSEYLAYEDLLPKPLCVYTVSALWTVLVSTGIVATSANLNAL